VHSGFALLVVVLVSLLKCTPTAPPALHRFVRTYGGPGEESGNCAQQTEDGGYILAGWTNSRGAGGYDFYLVKTDAGGDTMWTRTYGGSGDEYAYSVRQTSDNGYVVVGATVGSWRRADSYGIYMVKTDTDGDTMWTRIFEDLHSQDASFVEQTSDGGYVVAGTVDTSGEYRSDICLIKTDADGTTEWTTTCGGEGYQDARSIRQTSDDGFTVTGAYHDYPGESGDVILVRLGVDGLVEWATRFGGSGDDWGNCAQQTTDGGYIVVGGTTSSGNGGVDVYLVKTDVDGVVLWSKTYGGSESDEGTSVAQTLDGGYILAGTTSSYGGNGSDVYLIRTDSNGDSLWTRTFGTPRDEWAGSVQQTADSGYVIAGTAGNDSLGNSDMLLIKTDANGSTGTTEP
jgi:hypothetical protein